MTDRVIRDLGDGLVLRKATLADADALAQFDGCIHRNENQPLNPGIVALVNDMAGRPHPTMAVGDFTIVEDVRCKRIVSSLCLINQTWTYAGIPFGVGRPELVGTDPDYRNRGLIRAQFEEIHRWSAERGQVLQGITGIPYYYRQFGYEYALPLGGGRTGAVFEVPALKAGISEPFRMRPAKIEDVPFLQDVYNLGCKRSLVSCVRDEQVWRYDIEGRSEKSFSREQVVVVETADGQPVGALAHAPHVEHGGLAIHSLEVSEGVSWLEVAPSILRYLKWYGEKDIAAKGNGVYNHYGFWLGTEHPFFNAAGRLLPNHVPDYGWYIRVPDVPGFLKLITPALEQRLAASNACGYTGDIQLSFYRSGLCLGFAKGKLNIRSWTPTTRDWGSARFPNLTFLQLLLGYRALAELQYAFPDCNGGNDETQLVLNTLFPRQYSAILTIE
ncbi:MAG: GNAT family N-acetyltransferase [Anaerolineae bacterium]